MNVLMTEQSLALDCKPRIVVSDRALRATVSGVQTKKGSQ